MRTESTSRDEDDRPHLWTERRARTKINVVTDTSERGAFILVLEDDSPMAQGISRVILRSGVATPRVAPTFATGAALLGSFNRTPSAVRRLCGAILDVTVPGGSGFDLIPLAREVAIDLPILILTGDPSREVANAAQRFGVEFAYKLEEDEAVRSFVLRISSRDREPRALAAFALAHGLTAAEIEIVGLSLQGLCNKEIEARLQITEGTRKSHVHSLLGRCRQSSLDAVCEVVRGDNVPEEEGL